MDKKKISCPLKFGGQNFFAQEPWCEKELCAWWVKYNKSCALCTIADILADSSINNICWGPVESCRKEGTT